jgi:hypothetical protein
LFFFSEKMDFELDSSIVSELPSITKIQNKFQMKRLKKRTHAVETAMFESQTITLEGCNQLRGIIGQHWTSRILGLFTDARIPHAYILNMSSIEENEPENEIPNTIKIELITYRTKLYVFSRLLQFLTENRKNVNIYKN